MGPPRVYHRAYITQRFTLVHITDLFPTPFHPPNLQASGGSGSDGNQCQERDNSATRFSGSQRNDGMDQRMREASPEEVMGGGSGDGAGDGQNHHQSNDMDVTFNNEKTNSGSGGGDNGMHDGGSGNGSGADDDPSKQLQTHGPHLPQQPRFDFHDFPRKMDQADDANAEVRAAVREVGREVKLAKHLAKQAKNDASKVKEKAAAAAEQRRPSTGNERLKTSEEPDTKHRETRSASKKASGVSVPPVRTPAVAAGKQSKDVKPKSTVETPQPAGPEDAQDATRRKPSATLPEAKKGKTNVGVPLNTTGGSQPGGDKKPTGNKTPNASMTFSKAKCGNVGAGNITSHSLPRMPPPGYRGVRHAPAPSNITKQQFSENQTNTLMQSKHRSIFLAGGAVSNVDRISDKCSGIPPTGVGYDTSTKQWNSLTFNKDSGVVDQIFESGKHVEVILGARVKINNSGTVANVSVEREGNGPNTDQPNRLHQSNQSNQPVQTIEYLVKWIGHSHIHNSWMAEDPLDQLAPAKFGEYVLAYGRVPRMLADERWSKPQRVVAVHKLRDSVSDQDNPRAGSEENNHSNPEGGGSGGGNASGGSEEGARGSGGSEEGARPSSGGGSHQGNKTGGSLPESPAADDDPVNTKVLIKWWGLPYDSCTWEAVDVHPDLPKLLERYRTWTKSSINDTLNGAVNGGVAAARAVALVKSNRAGNLGSGSGGGSGGSGSGSMSGSEEKKTNSGDGSGGTGSDPNAIVGTGNLSSEGGKKETAKNGENASGGSVDISDTDAGVTDTTDTVAGAVKAARVNVPKDSVGKRHRHGSASSSSDPAVRWLLSAWMHREGVVMIYPEPQPAFGGVLGSVISSLHGDKVCPRSRADHHARRCAAAIGLLAAQRSEFGARNAPALVIVPASALPGWIAEFSRWAPELDVVEYCGSAVSRHIVQEHEWSHRRARDTQRYATENSTEFRNSNVSVPPKEGKEGSPVSDNGPGSAGGRSGSGGNGSGSGGNGSGSGGRQVGSGGMGASGGSGSGKSLTVNFNVAGSKANGAGNATLPIPGTGSGGQGSGGGGSGSGGHDTNGNGSTRGASPATGAGGSGEVATGSGGDGGSGGAGSGNARGGGDPNAEHSGGDGGSGDPVSGNRRSPDNGSDGLNHGSGGDAGSGGAGSGGNGSGDGSDPASAAAAAAAAAVAAARRPKFHVLVASMDAAAQDLLLLRQVAWETMVVVEDVAEQRSVTMSALPRLGTVQSANRVLMLDGLLPNTTSELLSILDFIKQSPEGMLALERHLLGLEDVNAFAEASGILEQVCLDLSILKPPRNLGKHGTHMNRGRSNDLNANPDLYRRNSSRGAGAGSGIVHPADGGQYNGHNAHPHNDNHTNGHHPSAGDSINAGVKRLRQQSFNEGSLSDSLLRRPKAQRVSVNGNRPDTVSGGSLQRQSSHGQLPSVSHASHGHQQHPAHHPYTTHTPPLMHNAQAAAQAAQAQAAAAQFSSAAAAAMRLQQQTNSPSSMHANDITAHPMYALSNAMQTDPVAASAMMQQMQQMMAPMATTHGVNKHQLQQAQGGLFLLQQMMTAVSASANIAAAAAAAGRGAPAAPAGGQTIANPVPNAKGPSPTASKQQATKVSPPVPKTRGTRTRGAGKHAGRKKSNEVSPEVGGSGDGGGSNSGGSGGASGGSGGSGGSGRSRAGKTTNTPGAGA